MSAASLPTPKIVVFGGTRMRTRAACAAAEASARFFLPADGIAAAFGPSGSYIVRNAWTEYISPVAGSGRA